MSGRRVPTPEESGPITADLSLISDCVWSAFIDGGGALRWLSRKGPRVGDAAAGDSLSGAWSLRPEGEAETSRRYLPGTLVLETTFVSPHGRGVLIDALLLRSGDRGHDIGQVTPGVLARSLRVTEGSLSWVGRLEPPPGGRWVLRGSELRATGGPVPLRVDGPAPDGVEDGVAM